MIDRRNHFRAAALLFLLLLTPAAAHAAIVVSGYGPRAGISVDPDQIVVGGQFEIADVAPDISFVPSLDLGFGDDRTVIAMNFDLHYHFTLQDTDWKPYAGFGAGMNFVSIDRKFPQDDISDTAVGANLFGGAAVATKSGSEFFTELRFGLGGSEVPSLKLMVGWNFH